MMTIKISVTGIRGKSSYVVWMESILRNRGYKTLAKVTGESPYWIHNGIVIPIERKNGLVFLDESLEYKKYFFDIFIAENQGIRSYTMRVFNDMINPDIGVITNIRLDHTDTMGDTYEKISESIGYGLGNVKTIISGERRDDLNKILKCLSKSEFILVNSESSILDESNPLNNILNLVNTTLITIGMSKLSVKEVELINSDIERQLKVYPIKNSNGFLFNGAKLNDVDSSEMMLKYLINKYPLQSISIVSFLRHDRAERTKTFITFFKEISKLPNVKQILLKGYGSKYVADNVISKTSYLEDDISVDEVIGKCDNSILFTCCNGVNTFIQSIKEHVIIKNNE